MKLFLSSTFMDLQEEREAVLKALRRKGQPVAAMEYFLATPSTPLETALQHLRTSDLIILLIGFKAGSVLPSNADMTYTSAEYAEAMRLGMHVLAFVREAKPRPSSKRPKWINKERSRNKADALNAFRTEVASKWTWDTFTTADQLALAVIQSLESWENQGRPGARKTFSSPAEFFASKVPPSKTPMLDFTTSLRGRQQEIEQLNSFLDDDSQSVCVVSGRGGIGKSKVLHYWTRLIRDREVVFLKDAPLWHQGSYKEIPVGSTVLIVDDAHRSDSIERVAQLFKVSRTSSQIEIGAGNATGWRAPADAATLSRSSSR